MTTELFLHHVSGALGALKSIVDGYSMGDSDSVITRCSVQEKPSSSTTKPSAKGKPVVSAAIEVQPPVPIPAPAPIPVPIPVPVATPPVLFSFGDDGAAITAPVDTEPTKEERAAAHLAMAESIMRVMGKGSGYSEAVRSKGVGIITSFKFPGNAVPPAGSISHADVLAITDAFLKLAGISGEAL